jgi:hypothetical protein
MNSLLENIKNINQFKSSNIDNKGTSNKIPINQQKENNNQKTNFFREFQSAIEKGLGKSSESTDNKLKNKLTEIKKNNTLNKNEDENIFSGSSSSSSDEEEEEEEEEDQIKEFDILNSKKKKNEEHMFSSSSEDDDDDDDDSSNSDNSDDSSNSDNESNKKRKKRADSDDNDMNNLYNLKFGANKHNKIINDSSKNNNRINSNKKTKTVKSIYESYQEKESIKLKSTGQDIRLVTIGNVNYVILKDIYSNCGLFGAATKSYKSSKKYIKVDGRRACVLDISNTAALLDKTRKTFSNSNLNEGESETRKKVKIFKDARIELLKILHERFHEELKDIIESPQENNQSKRASKKQKINNNNNNNNNTTTKSEIEINDDNNSLKRNKIENNNIIEHIINSNDDNSNFILSTLINILTKFWKSSNVPQYTKNEIFVEFTNKIFTILTPTNNDNNNNNNIKSII